MARLMKIFIGNRMGAAPGEKVGMREGQEREWDLRGTLHSWARLIARVAMVSS